MKRNIKLLLATLLALAILTGCAANSATDDTSAALQSPSPATEELGSKTATANEVTYNEDDTKPQASAAQEAAPMISIADIPTYSGETYAVINANVPFFTEDDKTDKSFETYSELDELGRCGVAYACVGLDIMPTEPRGEIGMVKPSGWHTVKYDCVDGKYLYNRCHLLGYQLTGENANEQNLITGTRWLNVEGMLPFENEIADYVESTGNHVLYRVSPIFQEDNLLADGVLMEGLSVEDNGKGVQFNVYVYNAQPGIEINYTTGDSSLLGQNTEPEEPEISHEAKYIININTNKFHYPDCSSVDDMKPKNRRESTQSREELIESGYVPCKRCNP